MVASSLVFCADFSPKSLGEFFVSCITSCARVSWWCLHCHTLRVYTLNWVQPVETGMVEKKRSQAKRLRAVLQLFGCQPTAAGDSEGDTELMALTSFHSSSRGMVRWMQLQGP
jgi:hypothetical protein